MLERHLEVRTESVEVAEDMDQTRIAIENAARIAPWVNVDPIRMPDGECVAVGYYQDQSRLGISQLYTALFVNKAEFLDQHVLLGGR